jgi:hypothetical protein
MKVRHMRKILALISALLLLPARASALTVPYTFSPGQIIYSAQVNANFNAIYGAFNTGIYPSQIAPTTPAQATFGGTQVYTFPNGIVADVPNKVFNVRTYGAQGNGTTDDTVAIQAALTAAQVAGGIVHFPQGQYKVSSSLTITGNAGGIVVEGAGRTVNNDYVNGTVIEPTLANGNVFIVNLSNGAQTGGIHFHDFSINSTAQGATITGGNDFVFENGGLASITVDNIQTWGAWNIYNISGNGGATGTIYVENTEGVFTKNDDFVITGNTGGLNIHSDYYSGNGSSSKFIEFAIPSGEQIDPFYIKDVDVESTGAGIIAESSNAGMIVDGFIDGLLIDGTTTDSPIRLLTHGSGGSGATSAVSRLKIVNSWLTTSATGLPAVEFSSNGVAASYLNGVDEVIIANSNVTAGSGPGISVEGGTADVNITGNMLYGSSGCGVNISQGSSVTVSGNRIGNVYGIGNSSGVCVAPASGNASTNITITGNDLTGNTNNALVITTAAGGILGLSVAGNNMSGYATPVSGTIPADSMFRGNKGYAVETSDATSTTTRFGYNALTACTGTNLLADFQNAGTSKAKIDCSGTFTAGGGLTAIGSVFAGGAVSAGSVLIAPLAFIQSSYLPPLLNASGSPVLTASTSHMVSFDPGVVTANGNCSTNTLCAGTPQTTTLSGAGTFPNSAVCWSAGGSAPWIIVYSANVVTYKYYNLSGSTVTSGSSLGDPQPLCVGQ